MGGGPGLGFEDLGAQATALPADTAYTLGEEE